MILSAYALRHGSCYLLYLFLPLVVALTDPRFSQIYQRPMASKLDSGLHHKLRAIGMRTLFTTFAVMPFGNVISGRGGLIEAIGASKAKISDAFKVLVSEKIIYRNTRIIRVHKRYCSKDKHGEEKKDGWFKLNSSDEAVAFINHDTLGFYEHCVILAIFSYLEYGNEFNLNISQTARLLGIPRNKCSEAFKALLALHFIYKENNVYYLNPKIAGKGLE